MTQVILTLNAGSSSVKFAVFLVQEHGPDLLAAGQIEPLGAQATFSIQTSSGERTEASLDNGDGMDHAGAAAAIVKWFEEYHGDKRVVAVGHRVVHGGVDLVEPIIVDAGVLRKLKQLVPLAPLHQPYNIAGIEAASRAFAGTNQVACFDTSFHRRHPYIADTYALPRRFYDEGIRRYGFHGLSYEFISRRLGIVAPSVAAGRVIVAHLGNGASVCAIRDSKSIACTMGFTPLDGLPMGTRCGQLDPGVVLYLMGEKGMDLQAISDLLYKESGLQGLSGVSHDMRVLEAADRESARTAIAYFVSRIRHEIGGMSAIMGGLDAIVFTGGIGEHAWRVRQGALSDMGWMGIDLDMDSNRAGRRTISTSRSKVLVFVLQTDEERMIAEHTGETTGLFAKAVLPTKNNLASG